MSHFSKQEEGKLRDEDDGERHGSHKGRRSIRFDIKKNSTNCDRLTDKIKDKRVSISDSVFLKMDDFYNMLE